jgi:regulator of sigma E protease
MSYFLAFLGFALLILLHEGGHFLAAKAVGMRVERFSLFFGPMFVKRQIGETEYGIGVLPLGGYVKITGMSPNEEFDSPEIAARAYVNQPPWKRIVVIAAGPAVNLMIAFLLVWFVYVAGPTVLVTPQGAPIATNTVGKLTKGSAAAGLIQVGDKIVSVNGAKGPVPIHNAISKEPCAGGVRVDGCAAATPATVVLRRDGVLKTMKIDPRWSTRHKEMLIGITWNDATVPTSALTAARQSVSGLWRVTEKTVSVIANIFQSSDRHQLHSIVGAGAIASQEVAAGWQDGLDTFALISLSLGLINLVPLLPLDGGHIFWAVAEKLRGRRIPLKVMERASFVGIAMILLLMVVGLSNDISSLAGSGIHVQ